MSPILHCFMSYTCVVIVTVLVVLYPPVITSLKYDNMICDRLQECVCGFPSGHGINLTSLGQDPLKLNDSVSGLMFYFNPCTTALAACSNSSLFCVLDEKANHTTNLGSRGGSSFLSQGMHSPIYMHYEMGGISTNVQLLCSDENVTTFSLNNHDDYLEPQPEVKYHFVLQSPAACLQLVDLLQVDVANSGLSSGSIFFLVLLIFFCVYICAGAAFNLFIRGATGWEIIPNIEFWRSLPNTLMNGVKYLASGCRPSPSYEQI